MQLQHPGIPQLVDRWEEGETEYLVMEYIPGKNLQKYCENEGLSEEKLLLFGEQICEILCYLHSRTPPVIHGDLKPENLLITERDRLYLLDFGSARCGEVKSSRVQKGTAHFAAPEQKQGTAAPQSDIYCLGEMLAFLLKDEKKPSKKVRRMLKKCRNKQISRRYRNAEALLEDFQKAGKKEPRDRRFLLRAGLTFFSFWIVGTLFLEKDIGEMSTALEMPEDVVVGKEKKEEKAPVESLQKIQEDIFRTWRETAAKPAKENIAKGIRRLENFWPDASKEWERRSALFLLGSLYEMQGENQKAEEIYLHMVKYWPGEAECAARYGLLLIKEGKKEVSRKYYESAAFTEREKSHNYKIWEKKLKEENYEEMDEETASDIDAAFAGAEDELGAEIGNGGI